MSRRGIKTPLAVVVLTLNEEDNLPSCLASVHQLRAAVFVIDSGSSDRTVEIARSRGAEVLTHPFETHVEQWRWALGSIRPDVDWILGLDADQRLTPEAQEEIQRLFTREQGQLDGVDGFYICRRQIFRGRWIRHGTYYPKYLLKLFRRSAVLLDERDLMDHHFYVAGPTRKLRHDLIEDNHKERDIAFWIDKHNRYARLLACEELLRGSQLDAWSIKPAFTGSPDQRVAWLKRRWYALPLYVRPLLYFVYRYVLRLGLLDGWEGFVFHFLHAYWFRLLVDIHLHDLRQAGTERRADAAY